MRSLSLSEEVAQLFVLPFDGEAPHSQSEEYARYLHWVQDLRIGGLVLVNRVQNGVVRHSEPHALAAFLNRIQRTARQARALGVHWILAPVADVNNNPDNPIINIRS